MYPARRRCGDNVVAVSDVKNVRVWPFLGTVCSSTVTGVPIKLPALTHTGISIRNKMTEGKSLQFLGLIAPDDLVKMYKPNYPEQVDMFYVQYNQDKRNAINEDIKNKLDKKQYQFWRYLLNELLIYRYQFMMEDEVFSRVQSVYDLDPAWNELIRRFVKRVVEVDSTM